MQPNRMKTNPTLVLNEDVVFVDNVSLDRRPTSRTIVGMRGHCRLNNWRAADGNRRVFDCSVVRMTPRLIEIAAPVTGTVGEWVDVIFDTFGKFDGPVIRSGARGFLMRIVATEEDRSRVAKKIAWLENKNAADARRHPRFIPFDPLSVLTLADTSTQPCQVIDYSASGVALSADVQPPVGEHLQVGKLIGRVVRRFAGGFAIEFAALQDNGSIRGLFMSPAGQV
jgi:hypothetical protein